MATYDRKASEQALIRAIDALIARDGFEAVGVNAIAREANVNKSLIYRYFGGIDGLYKAYAESHSIWPSLGELLGDVPAKIDELDWREAFVEVMMHYAKSIRARPLSIELLAWECTTRNGLTIALEEVRERRSNQVFAALLAIGFEPPVNLRPHVAFIVSSIHYLLIRGRNIKVFGGAMITTDEFWEEDLRAHLRAFVDPLGVQARS